MKQPDLGLKIAELRQRKGFTQEELVNTCNISVRTLQRIESGEVTPRSHTLKLIFEVLDFNFFGENQIALSDTGKSESKFSLLRNRFFNYLKDLFNLKTNTMKKLMILSTPVVLITLALFLSSYSVNAQKRIQKKLIGTWQICKPDGTLDMHVYNKKESIIKYKIITKDLFMLSDISPDNKSVLNNFCGSYTLEDNVYSEFIEYTTRGYRNLFGSRYSYQIEIKEDFLYIKGINNKYNEVWKRVKR